MAKYRIIKKWSNEYERFFFHIEQKKFITGWWGLSSHSTIDRAEEEILRMRERKVIKNEIIKEYEF